MKKKNIRKYILEALAGLLVIGACLTINELSRKKAYATEMEVSLTVTTDGIKASYNNSTKEFEEATNSIDKLSIEIVTSENDVVFTRDNVPKSGILNETVTFQNDKDLTYTLYVTGCTFTDNEISFEKCESYVSYHRINSSDGVTFDLSHFVIETQTPAPTTVNWTTSGTPKFFFSDGTSEITTNKPTLKTLTGEIQYTDSSSPSRTVSILENNPTSFEVAGTDNDFKFGLTGCSMEGAQFSRFNTDKETAVGNQSDNQVVFNLSGIEIVTDREKPVDVDYVISYGTPTVYYSDGTTPYASSVNVSSYTGKIIDEDNKEYAFSGTDGTIQIDSAAKNKKYRLVLTGCTISDGSSVDKISCKGGEEKLIDGKKLTYSLSDIKITTTKSAADLVKVADGEPTGDEENFKVSLDASTIKSILKSQTGAKKAEIDPILADAIKNNKTITLKLKIDDSIEQSDEEKIEKKAKDSKPGAKIGETFELTLLLYVSNESTGVKINDTGDNRIKITYTLSDSLKSSSSTSGTRYFRTYYRHNDSVDSASDWKKAESNKISFNASKFSPYAITYYDDGSNSSSSSSTARSNSASVPGQGDDAAAGGTDKSKTPKTGDDFNPRIWIYLLIVCATVASAAWILLQDTRDERKSDTGAKQ